MATCAELRERLNRYNPWDRDKWARLRKAELLGWCEYYEVEWANSRHMTNLEKYNLVQGLIEKHRAADTRKPRAPRMGGRRR